MINFSQLIKDLNEAFNGKVELPVALWYSDEPAGELADVPHCIFAALPKMLGGETVTFSEPTLKCGGGKTYCAYRPLNPNIPKFVSGKERYKDTPESVAKYVDSLEIKITDKPYLNFCRIDTLPENTEIEGVFFIAPPDIISGLSAWAFFDNNDPTAVQTLFASGCAATVTFITSENRRNGRSCFIGMMDISARKYLKPDQLSFAIPHSRLIEMAATIHQSCLFDAPAWQLIRGRL